MHCTLSNMDLLVESIDRYFYRLLPNKNKLMFVAGQSTAVSAGTGGAISLSTGEGGSTSSGRILVETKDAGTTGVSGHLTFISGTSSSGGQY